MQQSDKGNCNNPFKLKYLTMNCVLTVYLFEANIRKEQSTDSQHSERNERQESKSKCTKATICRTWFVQIIIRSERPISNTNGINDWYVSIGADATDTQQNKWTAEQKIRCIIGWLKTWNKNKIVYPISLPCFDRKFHSILITNFPLIKNVILILPSKLKTEPMQRIKDY